MMKVQTIKFQLTVGTFFTLKVQLPIPDLSTLVNVIQLSLWIYAIARVAMLIF